MELWEQRLEVSDDGGQGREKQILRYAQDDSDWNEDDRGWNRAGGDDGGGSMRSLTARQT